MLSVLFLERERERESERDRRERETGCVWGCVGARERDCGCEVRWV